MMYIYIYRYIYIYKEGDRAGNTPGGFYHTHIRGIHR